MNSGRRTARQEEEYHVLRRNAEMRKQEERTNVDSYFKTWNIKTTKYASWTSPQYFKQSDDARVEAERKEKKQQTLVERRDKLRQAMDAEYKLFRDELQGLNSTRVMAGTPLNDHKSYNPELKRRSEQSRKREAELKQYQQWYKQQQPELRNFQRKQHIEHLKKTWIARMKEYDAIRKQEAEAGEEYIRAKRAEIKRQIEENFEEKFSKEEEIKWLEQQIEMHSKAINGLDDISKEIVKEVAESRELQAKIEKMIIKRHLLERKQADKQLATHQYQLKLQKKAKEMEDEITQDQKLLEKLSEEMKLEAKVKK